ncbi:unnamed protein product, partial [Meganyctiphanes norvegica]
MAVFIEHRMIKKYICTCFLLSEWQPSIFSIVMQNSFIVISTYQALSIWIKRTGCQTTTGRHLNYRCSTMKLAPLHVPYPPFWIPLMKNLLTFLLNENTHVSPNVKTTLSLLISGLLNVPTKMLSCGDPPVHKLLGDLATLSKLQTSAVLTQFLLSLGNDQLYQVSLDQEIIFPSRDTNLLDTMSSSLEKKINFTRSYWLRDDSEEKAKAEVSYEAKKSDVYIAVHSLSLHMQAALYKVQEMELRFQTCDIDNVGVLENAPPYELVCEQLAAVKMELESCMGCWEEGQQRVLKKYNIEDDSAVLKLGEGNPPIPNMDEEVKKVIENKKKPIILFDMVDPVIQDEVFEAYIDQEYSAKTELDSEDDLLRQTRRAEREKLKRNMAQGKRVLKELQPILVKRREIWEKREELAAKRQQQQQHHDPQQQQENNETTSQDKEEFMHSDSEDSDEERLENYRRIRKQMEEEEKDQDTKKTEREKRINIFDYSIKCNGAASEEEDSDEERLQQYHAVRASLEEQEK